MIKKLTHLTHICHVTLVAMQISHYSKSTHSMLASSSPHCNGGVWFANKCFGKLSMLQW